MESLGQFEIEMRLFGAFRKYEVNGPFIRLKLKNGATTVEIKEKIKSELKKQHPQFNEGSLVDDSAIANDEGIMGANDQVLKSCTLAILPPVCGG